MRLYLAKTLEGIKKYGPIYNLGSAVPDKVETYYSEDANDWFLNNMVDRINETCNTLLDDGDVDFIDAKNCKELVCMIKTLPENYIPLECKELMGVLLDYAQKAMEFNTGIVIEM